MRRRAFIAGLGAAALPLPARAQQTVPTIGYLSGVSPGPVEHLTAIFWDTLKQAGYVEGQNIRIEQRWAEGQFDRLPALAADLVRRRVNMIVAVGGDQSVIAAKGATASIPIVFTLGADPVRLGLVASLNRPGGNMTGVTQFTTSLEQKRFELLREIVPKDSAIALLVNPRRPSVDDQIDEVKASAEAVGQPLVVLRASNEAEIDAAFETVAQRRAAGLIVASDAFFNQRRGHLISLAARHAIPTIYQWREFTALGGLMSYGTSLGDAYQIVGRYTARGLKGEKPADLPVQQVVKVYLVLNLKTAKSLGVSFPLSLLGRADEVIE